MTARARGFALVSAVFMMVILAALGGVLVTISSVQHGTSALGTQAERAYLAARSGLQWGTWKALGGGCPAGPTTFTFTEAALAGFEVSVRCTLTTHPQGAGSQDYWVIDVMARSGTYGSADFVSRSLRGKVVTS